MHTIDVKTHRRNEMIDITAQVNDVLRAGGINEGNILVFIPHTTAGVTINENADPDVVHDILLTLEELIPNHHPGYRHAEGNSDAHVKASLVGSSVSIIVEEGGVRLGVWQSIYFCEFDGPRRRKVFVQIRS